MEMHQVRYFVALCEEGRFIAAARRCGVSQPSLTNAVRRLEQDLGGPLFHRSRSNTRLTRLGILVRPDLESIDRSAAKAKCKAERLLSPSVTHQPKAMDVFMRAHHVIAVVAVLAVGFGAKQLFFSPSKAVAILAQTSRTIDLHALMQTIDVEALPRQEIPSTVYE